ncbi:MAG TPA: ABC transporter ATP-binding protein [Candidatus Lokiarchaeia archaeon]|nr:ABC transporter ATP-binding protein [Candidatus Lokiarchaeia archaeon]
MMRGLGPGLMGFRRQLREERKKARLRDIKRSDLQFIIPHLKGQKWGIVYAIIITTLMSATGIIAPLISQVLIDDDILKGNIQGIFITSAILIIVYGLNWLFSYSQTYSTVKVAQAVIRDVRRSTYDRILSLSLRFNNERKKGELLSLVTNDVDQLSDAFSSGIISIFSDVVTLMGVLAVMILLDPTLTAITMIVAPLIMIVIILLRGRITRAYIEVRRKIAQISANLEENITGIRVVQALNVESRKNQDFSDLSRVNFQASMKATVMFAIMSAVISINSFVAFALVIGFGGWQFIQGAISLGGLVAFFQYVIMFLRPIQDLVSTYGTFQQAAAALLHISEYMQFPIDVPEPSEENRLQLPVPVQGRIDLKNISFSYGEEPFMDNVDLIIEAGEKVGIVGETGAGKTTLINLITRLYDVTGGSICLDGIDIRRVPSHELRQQFAVVSQNVVIFSDSIKNNIRFGRPGASDEEVMEAATLAHAHEFIQKMPQGYDTMLGDRGSGVSGGQKQLIAYARLILARPAIAILDEATSNIDSYTEDLIQQNMRTILEKCTTIVIAHRFATLHAVDRLILVENGKITDTGTHHEMYDRNAYYRELYDTQYSHL